jgi:hypothetical protein
MCALYVSVLVVGASAMRFPDIVFLHNITNETLIYYIIANNTFSLECFKNQNFIYKLYNLGSRLHHLINFLYHNCEIHMRQTGPAISVIGEHIGN